MECFPGQSKSGSKINALIALITINVDVNCTYYSHLSSLVAVEVVEVVEKIASSSDAFKLGLCQFTKDLFHYVAPFSDHEQLLSADYCLQQLATPSYSTNPFFVINLW